MDTPSTFDRSLSLLNNMTLQRKVTGLNWLYGPKRVFQIYLKILGPGPRFTIGRKS
jgi:hypothetical protein